MGLTVLSMKEMIFAFGFFMILGHCFPIYHKFKGGRGIFIYVGLLMIYIPIPMLIALAIAGVLFFVFKQVRFSQYFIVLFPPFLSTFFFDTSRVLMALMGLTAVVMGVLNYFVSKRLGEL